MSRTVEQALDSIWRSFPPETEKQYTDQRDLLVTLRQSSETDRDALIIESALTTLADAIGDDQAVIDASDKVLARRDYAAAETIAAALFRLKALHRLRRHEQEFVLVNSVTSQASIADEDIVRVLGSVLRNHRGNIRWTEDLKHRLQKALDAEPFERLHVESSRFPSDPDRLDDLAMTMWEELKRWNSDKTTDALASSD